MGQSRERKSIEHHQQALYSAQSGISQTMANLSLGDVSNLGSKQALEYFSGGGYWVDVTEDDGQFTVVSTGVVKGQSVSIEAIIAASSASIFDSALFAGNDSGDPLYELDLGGSDGQADEIIGDVYSGGDLLLSGDAAISGTAEATGSITGVAGTEGVVYAPPDLASLDFENTADFNALDLFLAEYSYQYDAAGGYAYQVPEDNPAHIFRVNPSDRKSEYLSTEKPDFFLEDPYENVQVDPNQNGNSAYRITLSGGGGDPGPVGNKKVYYIDGNLWLHNKKTYSFKVFTPESAGMQVTFVVKGNIYFSDNLFYNNKNKDAVAFIALKDDTVADSGNIYFGDPEFGTLKEMNAYMYAEGDFHDFNLDASGSTDVLVHGMMSAGNHVNIDRDYMGQHTKLTVDFDERVRNGDIELPGLSALTSESQGSLQLRSWRIIGGTP